MDTHTKLLLDTVKEIHTDVKDCQTRLHAIEILDAVQNTELKEHTRRSLANEKRLEKIEERQFREKLVVGAVIAAAVAIIEYLQKVI